MTGAPLPLEADAVVMHEQTRRVGDQVEIDDEPDPGQGVQEQGRIYRAGDRILAAGTLLSPACLALLASVGRVHARAWVSPIARDEPRELARALGKGMDFDVLVVTGGVSVGERDLVPAALLELGVKPVFHKVRLKPGKPIWFGTGGDRGDGPGTLVFGLPGNPVSSLVGFLLFIRPALSLLAGHPRSEAEPKRVRLGNRFVHKGNRPTYHPARWVAPQASKASEPMIETVNWAGSADLTGIANADGLAVFAEGDRVFQPGEIVPFLPLG
jgi:molybdopterin molybdotransferase